jgi:succinate dehydrogenase / fumarate reductase cytochrome b subunit
MGDKPMTPENDRPTSPHLQIYKLPLTGLVSISHRITGVALSLGLVFLVIMLLAIAQGETSYHIIQVLLNVWLIKLLVWAFIYALFFHCCHGIRHLIWDTGNGFERETLTQHALIEIAASLLLTIIALA